MTDKAKKKKRPRYKPETVKSTVQSALEDGLADLEELYNEMDDWASNMEGSNLENTQKCQTVRETADQLESAGSISVPELPEELGDMEIEFTIMVGTSRRIYPSRSVRCSNAVAQLRAAIEAAQEWYGDPAPSDEDGDPYEEPHELQELSELCDDADGCEFPRMFG